jgi:hypothetical protein
VIDSRQATDALADIDDTVRRVRQSQIYQLTSLIMLMWGVLVFAGNVSGWLWPGYGLYVWIGVYAFATAGLVAISAYNYSRARIRTFDRRYLLTFLFIIAFGIFCCVFGHFTPRQQTTFWPVYVMLFYMLAGVWFGTAFIVIGASIIALTLIGYVYIPGMPFLLWMAVVNGGGLFLGGLWMRRI